MRKRKEPLFGIFSVNENRFGVKNIKKRLKPILPTLKERKRYLAYEIVSDTQIKNIKAISEQIMEKCFEYMGKFGVAKAGIKVLQESFNIEKQRGLIRIGHKHVDELKSVLNFVEKINNKKVIIKSIGVSGIIKKAKERYL